MTTVPQPCRNVVLTRVYTDRECLRAAELVCIMWIMGHADAFICAILSDKVMFRCPRRQPPNKIKKHPHSPCNVLLSVVSIQDSQSNRVKGEVWLCHSQPSMTIGYPCLWIEWIGIVSQQSNLLGQRGKGIQNQCESMTTFR